MEYDVRIDDKNKILFCFCRGVVDVPSMKKMVRAVRKQSFELGYHLLYDVTAASLGIGIMDTYNYAQESATLYDDPAHRRGKAAILYKSDEEFWYFFETSARNVGVYIRIFHEQKEALEWLSSENL